MPTTRVRSLRLLLTLGLAGALSVAMPIGAGASGPSSATAGRAEPVAAMPAATALDRQAWVTQIAHDAFAQIQVAESRMAAGPVAAPVVASPAMPVEPPSSTPVAQKTPAVKAASTARSYSGTNHLWIPSLGISHAVAAFSCTRSTPPGAGVYRWGCAGKNNTYLFGHAWSTFKPLHDAYVAKRLHTGMLAYFADGSGRVRTYKVTAIKVVTPDQTAWAIAAQPVASMTLQTCVGSTSQYRLLVRLVAIN